jgi:hypothetical protein
MVCVYKYKHCYSFPKSGKRCCCRCRQRFVHHLCVPGLCLSLIIANTRSDKYDEGTKQFSQSLAIDGKEVSKQSIAVGKGKRFNTAVEVQYGFAGTIYSHCKSHKPIKVAAY